MLGFIKAWKEGKREGERLGRAINLYKANSYTEAYREFLPLLEKGDKSAQYFIGEMHTFGRGVAKDLEYAASLFEQSAAGFYQDSIFMAGWCHDQMEHYQEAIKWYLQAAELDDIRAYFRLGKFYTEGLGCERDIPEAKKWLELGACKGSQYCMYRLGDIFLEEENASEAISLFERAASKGMKMAMEKLSEIYDEGCLVPQDEALANLWKSRLNEA